VVDRVLVFEGQNLMERRKKQKKMRGVVAFTPTVVALVLRW
jgi:hypothetical protein